MFLPSFFISSLLFLPPYCLSFSLYLLIYLLAIEEHVQSTSDYEKSISRPEIQIWNFENCESNLHNFGIFISKGDVSNSFVKYSCILANNFQTSVPLSFRTEEIFPDFSFLISAREIMRRKGYKES